MENKELDNLAINEGKELNEETTKIVTSEKVVNKMDAHYGTNLAYSDESDNILLPGQTINIPVSHDVEMEKADAEKHLISQLAMHKLQKEKEAFEKLSEDEKIKDYIFKSEFYSQNNNFFHKNGYELSGSQKRTLRRNIEKAWKSGKYKLTQEERDNILAEINKASKERTETTTEVKDKNSTANYINDLNSLIFKK